MKTRLQLKAGKLDVVIETEGDADSWGHSSAVESVIQRLDPYLRGELGLPPERPEEGPCPKPS